MFTTRTWTGWWVATVGMLHTLFGIVVYAPGWAGIARQRFWNSVDGDVTREHAFWFTAFGPATILLGALMVWVEKHARQSLPRFVGYSLLAAVAVWGVLMPVSGMWLLIPPGVAIVRRR